MAPSLRRTAALLACLATACAVDDSDRIDPEDDTGYEGVDFDGEQPGADLEEGKADHANYPVPTDLPTLVAPEIIVSLGGLSVHLFDRVTGFSEVYPAGPGALGASGVSITPVGHFATGPSTSDAWWYTAYRWAPAYFAGLPFLRLTARNSAGQNTYGLHGPITDELIRGYVSHGCVRMAAADIVRLFWLVRDHASTPVTIQREVELDALGVVVDVGTTPSLWAADAEIPYGASVGPRP
ncbi:MAG: L,D-transpeptidase [Kofleriaceae bacterium]